MLPPRAIEVESHDLASRVDAEGLGAEAPGTSIVVNTPLS